MATALARVLAQRRAVAAEVEGILDAHPLAKVLTSMPGVGVRTAALICLARRRTDVRDAMLRDGPVHRPQPA